MTVEFDDGEKISYKLINFNISKIKAAETKILDFHLNDYLMCVDIFAKKLYVDDTKFSFKYKTSFYCDKKRKHLNKWLDNKLIKALMSALYMVIFELSSSF
jgi:hypothetical protein